MQPPPLTTFKGMMRQLNTESVNKDGQALLRVCAPYFFPIDHTDEDLAQINLGDFLGADHVEFSPR